MHGKSCSTGEAGVFLFSQFRHNARHDVSAPNKGGKRSLVAALLELKKVLVMQKRPREELENKKPLLKLDLHARESSHHLLITGKKPHDESPSS